MTLIPAQVLDKAIEHGLKEVYLQELIAATPKKTRFTSEQWRLIKRNPFNYVIENTASVGGKHGTKEWNIVQLLEFGTSPHTIVPRNKKALHWEDGSKDIFAKKVQHPGFKARLFVKRTLERPDLAQRFERFVDSHIRRQLGI